MTKPDLKTVKQLAEYVVDAVDKNYLLFFLITSHTQGKIKDSENLPFGMGKTTLAFWLNRLIQGNTDESMDPNWDMTFNTAAYNPYDFICLMDPVIRQKEGRLRNAIFDDLQASCPAEAGVPKAIRRMSSYLTTNRPEVATIIATADNINSISAPLRKLVMFELIVAHRGVYEIQKINYHKNYRKPLQDLGKLDYIETSTFPPLPDHIQKKYELWRATNKAKIFPQLKAELLAFAKLKDWNLSEMDKGVIQTLQLPVSKNGRDYVLRLPPEMGEKFYRETMTVALAKET
jgi:hypothetical protein